MTILSGIECPSASWMVREEQCIGRGCNVHWADGCADGDGDGKELEDDKEGNVKNASGGLWRHGHMACQELDGSWLTWRELNCVAVEQGVSDSVVRGLDESAELKLDRGREGD